MLSHAVLEYSVILCGDDSPIRSRSVGIAASGIATILKHTDSGDARYLVYDQPPRKCCVLVQALPVTAYNVLQHGARISVQSRSFSPGFIAPDHDIVYD